MCCEGNSKNLLLELSLVLCPSVALIFVWIVTGSVPFKWQTLAIVKNINRMWEWLEPWSKRINAWLHHLDLALPSHDSLIISHDHDLSILSCVAHPVLAVQNSIVYFEITCYIRSFPNKTYCIKRVCFFEFSYIISWSDYWMPLRS